MKAPRLAIALLALGASLAPLASAAALTAPKAVALSLPNPNSGLNQGYLPFQSCSSVGNCAVTGIYLGARGYAAGVIDYEVKGVWKSPLHVRPPSGYSAAKGVTMDGISCPSDGNCVALGQYVAKSNQLPTQGFMISEVRGLWHHAVTLSLPAGTNANPFVSLSQVACWSATSCVAAGSYVDVNNVSRAAVVSEVGGVWEKALVVGLPGNASAFAGAQFNEVTCVVGGSCLAAGTYNTITGAVQPLVALSVAGVWNRALEVNLPNAAANPEALFYGFKGVACANAGNCALGGQFLDKNGRYQGFFDNVVNGNVQRAQVLTPPAGAVQSGRNGGVVSISCPGVNACVAGAAYLNSANQYAALLVTEVNGVWSNDSTISLPGTATTVGVAGGVYSVQCFTTTTCQVSGSYQSAATRYDGFSLVTGV